MPTPESTPSQSSPQPPARLPPSPPQSGMSLSLDSGTRFNVSELAEGLYLFEGVLVGDKPALPFLSFQGVADPTVPLGPELSRAVAVLAESPDTCANRPPYTTTWNEFCFFPPEGYSFNGWEVYNLTDSAFYVRREFRLHDLSLCHESDDVNAKTISVSTPKTAVVDYTGVLTLYMFECADASASQDGITVSHRSKFDFTIRLETHGSVITLVPEQPEAANDTRKTNSPLPGASPQPSTDVNPTTPLDFKFRVSASGFNYYTDQAELRVVTHITHTSNETRRVLERVQILKESEGMAEIILSGYTKRCVYEDTTTCEQHWLFTSTNAELMTDITGVLQLSFGVIPDGIALPANIRLKMHRPSSSQISTSVYGEVLMWEDGFNRTNQYVEPGRLEAGQVVLLEVRLRRLMHHMRVDPERVIVCVPFDASRIKPYNPLRPDETACYTPDIGITDASRFVIYDVSDPSKSVRYNTTLINEHEDASTFLSFEIQPFSNDLKKPVVIQVLYKALPDSPTAHRALLATVSDQSQGGQLNVFVSCTNGHLEEQAVGQPPLCVHHNQPPPTYTRPSSGLSAGEIVAIVGAVGAVGGLAAFTIAFAKRRRGASGGGKAAEYNVNDSEVREQNGSLLTKDE